MVVEAALTLLSHFLAQPLLLFSSQNPPDPPQIYLTGVGDPPSLIPLGAVKGAGSPPLQVSMGPQFQQDSCGGAVHPVSFSTPSHSSSSSSSHPNQPSPVFVIINPPAPQQQQQQQATVGAPSAPPPPPPPIVTPPTDSARHPIIIKEEHLPSEEELLEIVSLEEKQVEEV